MTKSEFLCADIDDLKNTYDFIVIGSGLTGMTAAIQAKELGLDVIILEKLSNLGGNSMRASTGMNAVETLTQLNHHVVDSQASFYCDTLAGGKGSNDRTLLSYFVRHTESAIEWLAHHNIELDDITSTGGMSKKRAHRPSNASAIGSYLVKGLQKQIIARKIPLFNQTKVLSLLKTDGNVSGVAIEHPKGGKKLIKSKAVLIASGGFAHNYEMIAKLAPNLLNLPTTNHPGAMGDGIKLATSVGAKLIDMDKIQVHPTARQEAGHVYLIGEGLRGAGAILINHKGQRFVNEMSTRDTVTKAINDLHQDGVALVFDQEIRNAFKAVEFYDAMHLILSGNTLDELAEKLNVSSISFSETIRIWNNAQKSSKDVMFGRQTAMERGITKPPYYAIHIKPAIHYTMGGIKINSLTEVLDDKGEPIPGLFAAGEVTGGLHGDTEWVGTLLQKQ